MLDRPLLTKNQTYTFVFDNIPKKGRLAPQPLALRQADEIEKEEDAGNYC